MAVKNTMIDKDQTILWENYKLAALKTKNQYLHRNENYDLLFASSFCYFVLKALWETVDHKKRFVLRPSSITRVELGMDSHKLAREIAGFLAKQSVIECGHSIGVLYTFLLPQKYKSEYGIYYTPPVIAERLLDVLGSSGVNWATDNILDPACGGGAFLVPVANRIMGDHRIKYLSAVEKMEHLETRLSGIEIDACAGWITQVMLDICTYSEACEIGRRMKNVVKHANTIEHALIQNKKYQLIVGNPPYGRVTLNEQMRTSYERSLYGHANMYGLFIDAALRMKSQDGLIGYVTPTSFMGGKYFSNLRKLLMNEAPPLNIDFITERSGVFDKVLQETCLTVFGKNKTHDTNVHNISTDKVGYLVERVGTFQLRVGANPWLLPREHSQFALIKKLYMLQDSLQDYGYKVSTGPLVWNRHKDQLRYEAGKNSRPIIWSHSIVSGNFNFDYTGKKPKFIDIKDDQTFLECTNPIVLLQRTTSKEQPRRLNSAVLPQSFLNEWGGVVVENHVNMIYPIGEPLLSPEAISLVLNSDVVDRVFRCISGSVAVSATELHALPLPPLHKVVKVQELVDLYKTNKINKSELIETVEGLLKEAYGLGGRANERTMAN